MCFSLDPIHIYFSWLFSPSVRYQLAAHRDFRGPVFFHLLGIDMIIALPTNDDDLIIDIDRVIDPKDWNQR